VSKENISKLNMGKTAKSWPGIDFGVSPTDLAIELAMLAGFVCFMATLRRRFSEDEGRPGPISAGAKVLPTSLRPSPGNQSRRKQAPVLQTSLRPSPGNQSRFSERSPAKQKAVTSLLASSAAMAQDDSSLSARGTALNDSSSLNVARRDPIIASYPGAFHTSFVEGFGDKRKPSKDMRSYHPAVNALANPGIASVSRSSPNLYARDSRAGKPARVVRKPSSGNRYFAELVRRQGGSIPSTPTGPTTPVTPISVAPSTPCTPGPMLPSARLRTSDRFVERVESDGPGLKPLSRAKIAKQIGEVGKREGNRKMEEKQCSNERVVSWDCSRGEQEWDLRIQDRANHHAKPQ